jgi:membrane protease subunit HflK
VTSISLEELDYPQEVQQAVDDAQQAENDAGRYVLEADTYEMDIIPKARGRAARVRLDAEAYRDRVIRDAEGEAGRFEALLAEYQKAPRVTRDRLYLDAIEEVYSNSTKIIIDSTGDGGNLLYLPLDQLRRDGTRATLGSETNRASDSEAGELGADTEGNPNDPRNRRIRQ